MEKLENQEQRASTTNINSKSEDLKDSTDGLVSFDKITDLENKIKLLSLQLESERQNKTQIEYENKNLKKILEELSPSKVNSGSSNNNIGSSPSIVSTPSINGATTTTNNNGTPMLVSSGTVLNSSQQIINSNKQLEDTISKFEDQVNQLKLCLTKRASTQTIPLKSYSPNVSSPGTPSSTSVIESQKLLQSKIDTFEQKYSSIKNILLDMAIDSNLDYKSELFNNNNTVNNSTNIETIENKEELSLNNSSSNNNNSDINSDINVNNNNNNSNNNIENQKEEKENNIEKDNNELIIDNNNINNNNNELIIDNNNNDINIIDSNNIILIDKEAIDTATNNSSISVNIDSNSTLSIPEDEISSTKVSSDNLILQNQPIVTFVLEEDPLIAQDNKEENNNSNSVDGVAKNEEIEVIKQKELDLDSGSDSETCSESETDKSTGDQIKSSSDSTLLEISKDPFIGDSQPKLNINIYKDEEDKKPVPKYIVALEDVSSLPDPPSTVPTIIPKSNLQKNKLSSTSSLSSSPKPSSPIQSHREKEKEKEKDNNLNNGEKQEQEQEQQQKEQQEQQETPTLVASTSISDLNTTASINNNNSNNNNNSSNNNIVSSINTSNNQLTTTASNTTPLASSTISLPSSTSTSSSLGNFDNNSNFSEEIANVKVIPLSDIVKEGHLKKKGGGEGGRRNWTIRWFKLKNDSLSYYKKRKDSKPKGIIKLSHSKVETHSGKPFGIVILSGINSKNIMRDYLLMAETKKEQEEWIQSISEVINKLQGVA